MRNAWYFGALAAGPAHAVIALARPEVKERIGSMGFDILASSPAQLSAQIRTEAAKWSKVVKEVGIKVE